MTIAISPVNLPEQVSLYVDKVRSVDWQKHYNQAVTITLTIAAWIVVISKKIHQGWQFIAPHLIQFLLWVAATLEDLEESPPPLETSPPLQIQQDLKHIQKTTSKSRAPKRGFQ
tara:strand:- start:230 stop:571 length:342 start_codon:yes stop_codon:yes gene_type:complete